MPTAVERTPDFSSTENVGNEVRNVATYNNPMLAVYKRNLVKLIATGDIPGRSPVCQFVDYDGKIHWDSMTHFTVIDPTFLPPNQDNLRELNKLITTTTK